MCIRACQSFHLHWHAVVKLLYGLVVDGDGHLCVSVEGELHVVAGPVLPRRLVSGQLQVLAAPGQRWKSNTEEKSTMKVGVWVLFSRKSSQSFVIE